MSQRPDGHYQCDRCGHDVGNGSVHATAIITDLDPATGNTTPRRLDLCRDRPDPDQPGKTIQGCRDRVLTKKALRHHHGDEDRVTQTQQQPVDLEQVAAQTVQQLGAQLAMLTYELNAQRSAATALQRDVDEKTEQIAERDAELGRVRQASSLMQQRIQQLDGQLADARADTAVPEPADHEQQPADKAPGVEGEEEDTGTTPEEAPGES